MNAPLTGFLPPPHLSSLPPGLRGLASQVNHLHSILASWSASAGTQRKTLPEGRAESLTHSFPSTSKSRLALHTQPVTSRFPGYQPVAGSRTVVIQASAAPEGSSVTMSWALGIRKNMRSLERWRMFPGFLTS